MQLLPSTNRGRALAQRIRPWCVCLIGMVAMGRGRAAEVTDELALDGLVLDGPVMEVLAEMSARGGQFSPARLRALGIGGLSAILDQLLPETAGQGLSEAARQTAKGLIDQLGHDRFEVREAASERLNQTGPAVHSLVAQAAASGDAERSWRAARIVRRWAAERSRHEAHRTAAFAVYLRQLDGGPELAEIARRTRLVLEAGIPPRGRDQLLHHCLVAVADSNDDRYTDTLRPLLGHENLAVPLLVVDTVGSALQQRGFPGLLVEALDSDREEVVWAAIQWTPNCRRPDRRARVRRRLVELFEGDNDTLRFWACVPLANSFAYEPAADYLLAQTHSDDPQRRSQAIEMIGDGSNRGRPASTKLLAAMRPLLRSDDYQTRRAAARAMAVYAGEDVVRELLPLLDDAKASIGTEVGFRLAQQPDQQMLCRVLADAAAHDPNETIRRKSADVLARLDK
jgi:hypothetical protein